MQQRMGYMQDVKIGEEAEADPGSSGVHTLPFQLPSPHSSRSWNANEFL